MSVSQFIISFYFFISLVSYRCCRPCLVRPQAASVKFPFYTAQRRRAVPASATSVSKEEIQLYVRYFIQISACLVTVEYCSDVISWLKGQISCSKVVKLNKMMF